MDEYRLEYEIAQAEMQIKSCNKALVFIGAAAVTVAVIIVLYWYKVVVS